MDENKYQSWTLAELKAELKRRKITVSGRKKQLVERLLSLDLMGRQVAVMEPEYQMTLPDPSHFTDVNADSKLPPLPMTRITQYLNDQDKDFEAKIKTLYEERYVRMAQMDEKLFITGSLWAEMEKKVTHKVDLYLDQHQVIQEAQCECGAGQGPTAYCKHVACILYGIHRFAEKNDILTEQTCTQVLQKFHQAKRHKGSPMTAGDLEAIREQKFVYDPRPKSYRNQPGYPQHFRSTVLNFQGDSKMPVLQLFEPANPYAISVMHDYEKETPEEAFLIRERVSKITPAERLQLEIDTRGQTYKKTWHHERQKRITASNFGTICKATDRRNFHKLTSQLTTPTNLRTRAISHGNAYEQLAIEQFQEKHDKFNITKKCGLFVDDMYPWLGASPDGLVEPSAVLEVKCPSGQGQKN